MKRTSHIHIGLLAVLALLLAACGGGAAPADDAPAQEAAESAEAAEVPAESAAQFFLQVAKVVGAVEVRASAGEEYAPAQEGQQLNQGAQIRTGADGIVSLYRDALSMVVIDNNSEAEIKTLGGTAEIPVTEILLLSGAAALDHHAEKLSEGAIFSIITPEGNTGQIVGSTVRVQYNPETKIMTATCLTGTCEFVRGDQKLTLEAGQAVDVEGLQPPPGAPEEMSVDQANQFLAMGHQLCGGCPITIGEIRDGGLGQTSPAPDDLGGEAPTGEPVATDAATEPAATEAPSTDDSGGGDG